MHKYTEIDKKIMAECGISYIKHYDEKIERARSCGFNSYLNFVSETDKLTCSIIETGRIVGMDQCSTIKILRRMGIPPRPRGGKNNPWGRIGRPK